MCFSFDGESAVAAHRPETCGERLAAASALAPVVDHPSGGLSPPAAAVSFKPLEAGLSLVMNLLQSVDRCGQASLPGF